MAPPPPLTRVGQRVEADYFTSDFNYDITDPKTGRIKSMKIPTLGGATMGFVAVDCVSGYVFGRLTSTTANSHEHVKWVLDTFKSSHHGIELFAGDRGVIGESLYQVMTPATQKFLQQEHILFEVAEPYTHSHGGAYIEEVIKTLKELLLFAVYYIMHNPNFSVTKFSKFQI